MLIKNFVPDESTRSKILVLAAKRYLSATENQGWITFDIPSDINPDAALKVLKASGLLVPALET